MPHSLLQDPAAAWAEAEQRVDSYLRAIRVIDAARKGMLDAMMERARAHTDELPLVAAMRELHNFLNHQVTQTQGLIPAKTMTGSAAWRVAVWRHSDCTECTWRAVPTGALLLSHEGKQFQWRGGAAMPAVRRTVVTPAEIRPAPEGLLSRLLGLNEEAS
ncbi:MAG: hypothetical protein FNT29_08030 [Halothiobacillaceae bacterium]|nr:MAG: hypothetical protein FNT29_08030 [Halothiobacillaceae bacterium]